MLGYCGSRRHAAASVYEDTRGASSEELRLTIPPALTQGWWITSDNGHTWLNGGTGAAGRWVAGWGGDYTDSQRGQKLNLKNSPP